MKYIIINLWNRKKHYIGILIEQMLVFTILMISAASLFKVIKLYNEPGMFDTDNTLNFGYVFDYTKTKNTDISIAKRISNKMRVLMNKFKEKSYIEGITEGVNFIPFTYSNEFLIDTFHVDDKKIIVQQRISDASAINVFHPVIEEGEWITDEKLEDGTFPVVITRNLADELFDGQAIGKKIFRRSRSFTVNGIISGIKGNIFDGAVDAVIFPWRAFQMYSSTKELAVRVKGDNKETFYNDYINEFRKSMKFKEAVVEPFVYDMDIFKRQSMASTLFDITLLLVPTVCLFLFAFVGTFGLFWLTSKKRRKEFALKMAIGSSKRRIMREVISESVLISLVSCVPGLIIAAFIYPIDGLHLAALGITLGLMLVFSIFSAWYPAFKVTKIQPAQVLKYE